MRYEQSYFETEFQFSKILLNLGLQCSNKNYTVLHFKGISFLTAYLAIQVSLNSASFTGFPLKQKALHLNIISLENNCYVRYEVMLHIITDT